MLICQYYYKAQ